MGKRVRRKSLFDSYRFPGFEPLHKVKGKFGDRTAYVVALRRRQKKRSAAAADESTTVGTTGKYATPETSTSLKAESTLSSSCVGSFARNAAR